MRAWRVHVPFTCAESREERLLLGLVECAVQLGREPLAEVFAQALAKQQHLYVYIVSCISSFAAPSTSSALCLKATQSTLSSWLSKWAMAFLIASRASRVVWTV